jgi:ribosome-associated heat shock protein Hsp15
MRIDKYLWAIRVFKTRSIATDNCRDGKVTLNGEPIKPSKELKPGDILSLRKGPVHFSWKVIDFPKSRVSAKLVTDFAIDVTPAEELRKWELVLLAMKDNRPRGLGRPTKRERRDIDKLLGNEDDED